MTQYIIGYVFLSLMVIAGMNILLRKKGKKEEEKIAVIEENETGKFHMMRVLLVLMLGMFTAILNQTVLNVALPVMMTDLNVDATTGQWLVTGFMLVNGILIPVSAFLLDRFGFRKLFIAAMVSFTIGSFICAISDTFTLVMIGRIVQAIGAGILMPLGMNLFMTLFPPEKRGAAMGLFGIGIILAPALGPTISGWVVQNYHWNYMFYGMMFIGLIDVLLAYWLFHLPVQTKKTTIDGLGIVFSSIGFGSLLYGFSQAGSDGWGDLVVLSTLIIGIVFIGLFTYRQLNVDHPLLQLKVLRYKEFTFTLIINSIVTMSLFGAMLLLPIYLQNIRAFTPLESGLLLLPGALIMGVMGPIAGKLFDKFGIRILAVIGLGITTYATYEFTKLSSDTSYNTILGFYILRSFGMSFIMMPIMTAGMNALPLKLIPHGTAMSNTVRQVAGSIGTAILVTIMTTQTTAHFADYSNSLLGTNAEAVQQMNQMNTAIETTTHLSPELSQALTGQLIYAQTMKESTIQGINDAFLFATLLSLVAFIMAFFLQTPKINKEEEEMAEENIEKETH